MIAEYLTKRRLGLLKDKHSLESKIVNHLEKVRHMVQLKQYAVMRSSNGENTFYLAVDSSGMNALIGSSHSGKCYVRSLNISGYNEIIKYDQLKWSHPSGDNMNRVQFNPNGATTYAATSSRGLRIVDTNKNKPIYGYRYCDCSWSDWHPRHSNLIAKCADSCIVMMDTRLNKIVHREVFTGQGSIGYPTCCLWSPKNDSHLIVSKYHDSIITYDTRSHKLIKNTDKYQVWFRNLRMTPDCERLFGWVSSNNCIYGWKYDGISKESSYLVSRDNIWSNMKRQGNYNLQYHVTDEHLYIPGKLCPWLPDEGNRSTIEVYDHYGYHVNEIDAVGIHFDARRRSSQYLRVDAIVGLPDRPGQLYTLNNNCEIGVWSLSSRPQDEILDTFTCTAYVGQSGIHE